jgi:hypothetical protein
MKIDYTLNIAGILMIITIIISLISYINLNLTVKKELCQNNKTQIVTAQNIINAYNFSDEDIKKYDLVYIDDFKNNTFFIKKAEGNKKALGKTLYIALEDIYDCLDGLVQEVDFITLEGKVK